jgi:hypothetical protein
VIAAAKMGTVKLDVWPVQAFKDKSARRHLQQNNFDLATELHAFAERLSHLASHIMAGD